MRGRSSIPPKLKAELLASSWYKTCARKCGDCDGRITFEHAIIYGGRQVNKKWAIIPLCEYHHSVGLYQDGGDLNKEINEYIAISRMTGEDMREYPRFNWRARVQWLRIQYGPVVRFAEEDETELQINYPSLIYSHEN